MNNEHWDLGSIFAWIKHLDSLVLTWVKPFRVCFTKNLPRKYTVSKHHKTFTGSDMRSTTFQRTVTELSWLSNANLGLGIFLRQIATIDDLRSQKRSKLVENLKERKSKQILTQGKRYVGIGLHQIHKHLSFRLINDQLFFFFFFFFFFCREWVKRFSCRLQRPLAGNFFILYIYTCLKVRICNWVQNIETDE